MNKYRRRYMKIKLVLIAFFLFFRASASFSQVAMPQNHTQSIPRARVIVFVHGLHGSRESWRAVERRLLAGYDSNRPALRLFRR